MRRQMLRFLQKRKFRLVTRWKCSLKENIESDMPVRAPFPYALIFRTFDDLLHTLKSEVPPPAWAPAESMLAGMAENALPGADQYMELFLTGRDILGDFVESDPSFTVLFTEAEREELRAAIESAFRHIIDREMREHSRRLSGLPT